MILYWAAEATLPGNTTTGLIAEYGVLAIALLVLFVYAKNQTKRESDRADRLEKELAAKNDRMVEMLDRVIPTALELTRTNQEMVEVITQLRVEVTVLREQARDSKR